MSTTSATPTRHLYAVDEMDRALDLLRAVWLAQQATDWHDDDTPRCLSHLVDLAITALNPVRAAVDKAGTEI